MTRVRDYRQVIERLDAFPARRWQLKRVARVSGYPWFVVERVVSKRAPTVMLSAGMHGEEPGGVEGALRWLEQGNPGKFNWFVLPCINPFGWERNRRSNSQRRDINRQFHRNTCTPEAELIKRLVRGRRFLFSIEFHEDVGASGYYLYELRRQTPYVGEKVLRAVERVVPINHDKVIDGNEATGRGLIRRDAGTNFMRVRRRWPMAFHLFLHCTDHILGSETAVHLPLEQRARAHNAALAAALKHC